MKWIDKVFDERNEGAIAFLWQLVGPLFILCTFALAPENHCIFFAGVVGLFLCAKYRNIGFVISLFLLAAVAIVQYLYQQPYTLWEAGLEFSYAMAFFITAQSAARHQSFVKSVFSQLETKNSFALNLEEEFNKSRQEVVQQQIHAQEKIDSLQKQLDEIQVEQSSLLVLNEVLRKTTASHMSKKDSLTEELYQLQNRLSQEILEKEELKSKITEADSSSHSQLVEELNVVKREHEQIHSLKETLERLHSYEQQRALAATQKLAVMEEEKVHLEEKISLLQNDLQRTQVRFEELETNHLENSKNENDLHQKISHLENELMETRGELDVSAKAMAGQVQKITMLENELNGTSSKLEGALYALEENNQLHQKIAHLERSLEESKILNHSSEEKWLKAEQLYKQLRAQFDEKNAVLHQARSELFKMDNAYQALQIEIAQMDLGIPRDCIDDLQTQIQSLQEENLALQSIVTALSEVDTNGKKKSE